ncbi:MAG: hypothetical protein ABSH48_24480 [Verrucomicrobiota bacterium]|jgi:hypothetical protein
MSLLTALQHLSRHLRLNRCADSFPARIPFSDAVVRNQRRRHFHRRGLNLRISGRAEVLDRPLLRDRKITPAGKFSDSRH